MDLSEDLKSELRNELSYPELSRIARNRGAKQAFKSKEDIVDWLLRNGLNWRDYELEYNPYIAMKLQICKFLGIRKGWKVMDLGCGSGGTSVAAASLVGRRGKVLAIDQSKEEIERCANYVKKVGYEEIIETRLANVLDLKFENDYFDMIILLYTPQFLGYLEDLKEVLVKIKNWTDKIGIADNIPLPDKYDESIYLLYNWLSNDVARDCTGRKTDRLFHPEEIRNLLNLTGWEIVNERNFKVSKKNAWPDWAMKENIKRLSQRIETLDDPLRKEIFNSRLQTIKKLAAEGTVPKPTSMLAIKAKTGMSCVRVFKLTCVVGLLCQLSLVRCVG